METVLVLGASGLLGGKVAALARESFKVVATYRGRKPKIPRVDFVELLPRHDNGKLYRQLLRERYRVTPQP